MNQTARYFVKHKAEPTVFAVEGDDAGTLLAVLDVSDADSKGGLCPHLLASLPLAGRTEDVDYLRRVMDDLYDLYVPDCGNVHHLMTDLLALEREHRETAAAFALADSKAKAAKKDMELRAAKVHDLLNRINDRTPLPLFDAVGV